MSSPPSIVGIMLVKDEDRFLKRSALNILEFCDRILIADHQSQDGTAAICTELATFSKKFEIHKIREPRESHELLVPFANTSTWIFGVDGDEIYDPAGLARVRTRLHAGEWDRSWVVFGNVLNCDALDENAGTASGWLAPPCRSMTKLYNFSAVRALDPDTPHRLHGRNDTFNDGWSAASRHELYKEVGWEQAEFRCLHTCWMPRSSRAPEISARRNVTESLGLINRLRTLAARMLGRAAPSEYKNQKYRRGDRVTVDARPFLPNV